MLAQRIFVSQSNDSIPDNGCVDDLGGTGLGGVTSFLNIPFTGVISDVNVAVEVTHAFRSDLQAALAYESFGVGTIGPVLLFRSHDAGEDNYYAVFDQQAGLFCSDAMLCGGGSSCGSAPGPSCKPDGAVMGFFNGAITPGRFVLTLCDDAAVDLGTLVRWSVTVSGLDKTFDIDGDFTVSPLTDGLLVLRYTFGFRGGALISGAVDSQCERCTAAQIEAYLATLIDQPSP